MFYTIIYNLGEFFSKFQMYIKFIMDFLYFYSKIYINFKYSQKNWKSTYRSRDCMCEK